MNKSINGHILNSGDEIILPKSNLKIINHHPIYIGFDRFGIEWIIENNYG